MKYPLVDLAQYVKPLAEKLGIPNEDLTFIAANHYQLVHIEEQASGMLYLIEGKGSFDSLIKYIRRNIKWADGYAMVCKIRLPATTPMIFNFYPFN